MPAGFYVYDLHRHSRLRVQQPHSMNTILRSQLVSLCCCPQAYPMLQQDLRACVAPLPADRQGDAQALLQIISLETYVQMMGRLHLNTNR